jgi:hypothetical protein
MVVAKCDFVMLKEKKYSSAYRPLGFFLATNLSLFIHYPSPTYPLPIPFTMNNNNMQAAQQEMKRLVQQYLQFAQPIEVNPQHRDLLRNAENELIRAMQEMNLRHIGYNGKYLVVVDKSQKKSTKPKMPPLTMQMVMAVYSQLHPNQNPDTFSNLLSGYQQITQNIRSSVSTGVNQPTGPVYAIKTMSKLPSDIVEELAQQQFKRMYQQQQQQQQQSMSMMD